MAYGEYRGIKRIKPFIKYAESKLSMESELSAFRIYLTDTLYWNAQEKILQLRYYDIVNGNDYVEVDGDEIVKEIIEKAGLVVRE